MRSKIEANEYKDYILGFIFYKYLSEQLVQFVTKEGITAKLRTEFLPIKVFSLFLKPVPQQFQQQAQWEAFTNQGVSGLYSSFTWGRGLQ